MKRLIVIFSGLFLLGVCLSPVFSLPSETLKLREKISENNVKSLKNSQNFKAFKVKLGKKLYWDPLLSGNKDIACASCHHPKMGTSDGLSLSIGTKADGDHFNRTVGDDRQFISRNAQDLFNRGSRKWRTLFRDMRVRRIESGQFITPAGFELPEELNHLMAAQAMIPVASRNEMRGDRGDLTVKGDTNDIARIPDGQFHEIWGALWDRLITNKRYVDLFERAYPDTELTNLGFEHAANAIAAYQIEAFTFLNSPWDRYLKGDRDALSKKQKKGARIFYGKGKCSQCHAGTLMTDQEPHNLAVPQLGPGKEPDEPFDLGAYSTTGNPADRFAFRTPPLRNVTVTGPWMHNGAYKSLESAVRHHLNPEKHLKNYRSNQLKYDLRLLQKLPLWEANLNQISSRSHPGKSLIESVRGDKLTHRLLLRNLDPILADGIALSNDELEKIMAFLSALTSPSVKKTNGTLTPELKRTIPDTVPSGLPIPGT